MNIINLTPHDVRICNNNGETLFIYPKSGVVARAHVHKNYIKTIHGIDVYRSVFGEATHLPCEKEGTVYIVSVLVQQAAPERKDLVSPDDIVRDESGRIIGCKGWCVI